MDIVHIMYKDAQRRKLLKIFTIHMYVFNNTLNTYVFNAHFMHHTQGSAESAAIMQESVHLMHRSGEFHRKMHFRCAALHQKCMLSCACIYICIYLTHINILYISYIFI